MAKRKVPGIEEFKPVYTNRATLLGMSEERFAQTAKKVTDTANMRRLSAFAARNWDEEDDGKFKDPKNVQQAIHAARKSVTEGTRMRAERDPSSPLNYQMDIQMVGEKGRPKKSPVYDPQEQFRVGRRDSSAPITADTQPHQITQERAEEEDVRMTKIFGRGRR